MRAVTSPRTAPRTAEPEPAQDAASEDEILTRLLKGLWPGLPTLLAASAAVCTAAAVTVWLAPGLTPVSVLVAAVLLGPVTAALMGTVGRIAAADQATARLWWTDLRTLAGFGCRQSLLAALPTAVFLTAWPAWTQTGNVLLLPSLAVGGAGAVLAAPALPAALALGSLHPHLRGPTLWRYALHLTIRLPLRFLAAPTLTALGIWAATRWTASVLLLVPAPAAAVAVAAVWTSVVRLGGGAPGAGAGDHVAHAP